MIPCAFFTACSIQNTCKSIEQLRNVDRFCNVPVHAGSDGVLLIFGKGICRHGDDRDTGGVRIRKFSDSLRRVITVHLRHLDIHKNQVILTGRGIAHLLDGNVTVFGSIYNNAFFLKNLCGDFPVELIILDEKNSLSGEFK